MKYLKHNTGSILIALILLLAGCGKDEFRFPEEPDPCIRNGVDTCATVTAEFELMLEPGETRQTIHSFGGSDAWTIKFFGQWENAQKKNEIADLLFSMESNGDGSPKGIGLSMWRFNIGGGSYEQGTSSNIATDWRREESFLNADGSYDWDKQSGQQWFLEAARQRGVKYTLGFSLTPPCTYDQKRIRIQWFVKYSYEYPGRENERLCRIYGYGFGTF